MSPDDHWLHVALASLAYDQSGSPAIVHSVYGKIRFARRDGVTGAWLAEEVTSGSWASLAYDPLDGLPAISYGTSDDRVWWAKRGNDGKWHTEVVDRTADAAYVTRLKFDNAGNPCILYTHYIGKELRLACRVPQ
jgi:hypothetical protein